MSGIDPGYAANPADPTWTYTISLRTGTNPGAVGTYTVVTDGTGLQITDPMMSTTTTTIYGPMLAASGYYDVKRLWEEDITARLEHDIKQSLFDQWLAQAYARGPYAVFEADQAPDAPLVAGWELVDTRTGRRMDVFPDERRARIKAAALNMVEP